VRDPAPTGWSAIEWNRAERSRGRSRRWRHGDCHDTGPTRPEADLSRLLLVLDPAALSAGGDVSYFIIDGVRFARTHTDARTSPVEQPARILVLGVLPNNDDVRVLCEERAKPDLVRAGCQVVIDSLHVRT
jgi:hypothetical protein